ncbi:unnamed protein product [Scytosiphon promiscuus]
MHSLSVSVILSTVILLLQNSLGALAFVARASTCVSRIWNDKQQLPLADSKAPRLLTMSSASTSDGDHNAEVIVVGSCNTDLVTYTPRLPRRGETITGSRFETHHGGKGANQAVMARRMGVGVAMVACLGEDTNGASYLQNLSDEGIDCGSVRKDSTASTGVAQICVEEAGEGGEGGGGNFIVIVPGANNVLSPDDVTAATARLKGAKIIMCQSEVRPEATLAALESGRAAGMTTIFNPAPAKADLPDRYLELSDVLCPNETELALLCKGDVDPEDEGSVQAGAKELIARGAKNVVVTLGSKGCMLVSSMSEGCTVFPAEKVDAKDTVGAGDAFLGSLGAYLARGATLEDAIGKAVKVASVTVTRNGAQPSYPRGGELPSHLQLPKN